MDQHHAGKARPKTMNAKKAKAIRRYVRSLGKVKADLPRERTGAIRMPNPITGEAVVYDLPVKARYPSGSFQCVYKLAKRALRQVRVGAINDRAAIQAYGRGLKVA